MTELLRMNLVGNFIAISCATCTKCGERKPLSGFYRDINSGTRADCKTCHAARAKEYRRTHKAEIAATVKSFNAARAATRKLSTTDRRCSKCKSVKPVSQFYKNYQTVSGYHASCSDCVKAQRRECGYWATFYQAHKASIIEKTAEYARTHPEVQTAKQAAAGPPIVELLGIVRSCN